MDVDKPLVSVLMSTYNEDSEFLREAIESILNQSFRDFEFVIIGDNPQNDRINSIVQQYQHDDARIKFFQNESNIGLTRSLNVGLAHCQGEYVARMDADDISLPERLEKQVKYMSEHEECDILGGSAIIIDEYGNEKGGIKKRTNPDELKALLILETPILHPSVLFRRTIDLHPVRYDENYRYAQDYALWASLAHCNFANLPENLIKYRVTSNQITHRRRDEQLAFSHEICRTVIKNQRFSIKKEDESYLFALADRKLDCTVEAIIEFVVGFYKNNKSVKTCKVSCLKEEMVEHTRYFLYERCNVIKGLFLYVKLLRSTKLSSIKKLLIYIVGYYSRG